MTTPRRAAAHALVVGAGFIGAAVARGFVEREVDVRVLSKRERDETALAAIGDWTKGDAPEPRVIERALDDIDTVVWCAGQLLPSSPVSALTAIDDLSPLVVCLRALVDRPDVRLVFISSGGTVYGPNAQRPTGEDEPLDPRTPYAAIKAASEHHIDHFRRQHGLDGVVLRCSNVYGPGQRPGRPQGVIAHALDSVARDVPLELFADESSTRDYVYIDDVASIVHACTTAANVPPVMNVACGVPTKLGDLVSIVQEVAGQLVVTHIPERGIDVDHSELDVSVLRRFLPGFEPTPLPEGIAATWEQWPGRRGRA
jgi:UDP-glucose 4-epimerase